MKKLFSLVIQLVILGIIGWIIYKYLGAQFAYAILFILNILWLLNINQKNQRRFDEIAIYLTGIFSKVNAKK